MKKSELKQRYHDLLILRNYRSTTIRSYVDAVDRYLSYCIANASASETPLRYAEGFMTSKFKEGASWSSVNVYYSALRLLFVHVLELDWDYEMLPRPRGRAHLPTVLSGSQIEAMIKSIKNIKHQTIVVLMYSTGLRISEVLHLKLAHILYDRRQIKVVDGKGGKDRYVFVPPTTLIFLSRYTAKYRPSSYLFAGMNDTAPYSSSSIRKIIDRAVEKGNIPFKVNPHSLRYAYATHHIENGTDLVTLQHQLGHRNINTTIKYIKLCKVNVHQLNHPIEKLNIGLSTPTT